MTYAGFVAGFYARHRRQPTQQEVFDAGVKEGGRRSEEERPSLFWKVTFKDDENGTLEPNA